MNAIQRASLIGDNGALATLLAGGVVDPAATDNYAIRWASARGHLGAVLLLLDDDRVDPADRDFQAIRWAIQHGHTEVVKRLLSTHRAAPVERCSLVYGACLKGFTGIVELLLRSGRVDSTDMEFRWAINTASRFGYEDILRMLLLYRMRSGQIMSALNSKYAYAIKWATTNGHDVIIGMLLADNQRIEAEISPHRSLFNRLCARLSCCSITHTECTD